MASVSSTSSLGNTSLRGFGGMASGINRDEIIEKMTLGTTTKIANKKKDMQKLEWKQEAYRNISDQILDISDNYASYASGSNLKDPMAFAKNIVSVHGKDSATQFIQASGTSSMIENVSIKSVDHLATATVRRSAVHKSENGLSLELTDLSEKYVSSNLEGSQLAFCKWNSEQNSPEGTIVFDMPSTYEEEDENGNMVKKNISYVPKDGETDETFKARLVTELNTALKQSDFKIGDEKIGDVIQFSEEGDKINISGGANGYRLWKTSTALKGLGYVASETGDVGVTLEDVRDNIKNNSKSFADSALNRPTALNYLTGKKLTFNYDGSQKEIELITDAENSELQSKYKKYIADGKSKEQAKLLQLEDMAANIRERLNKAFGEGNVTASVVNGKLTFNTVARADGVASSSISIVSNNTELLENLGISYGESNKVNLNGKLSQSALTKALGDNISEYIKEGSNELDLRINGVAITGLTANSSINDVISKINANKDAGVKATYVDATGEFMLVSNETGAGRKITLESNLAQNLFGQKDANDKYIADGEAGGVVEGTNARIKVSYGNGVDVDIERSSNTFNLEGLNITVSGTFKDVGAVTFSAKADVDGAVEKVKKFFEDFNKLATDINNEVRTRPDSSYTPLTDEQKDEMDETSIENWEKKAKQGLLYGDSVMRDLNLDIQGIFTKMMQNGASYEDLKEIGITYSEDWGDGGVLVFDEAAFRTAMEKDPEKVSNIFTGGGNVKKGLISTVEDTFTPYATKYASKNPGPNGGSYGRLIEVAGSSKKPTTLLNNEIYKQLKEMENAIASLQDQLKVEQDRYISQFTTMESLINKMNTQSSYLSQITG